MKSTRRISANIFSYGIFYCTTFCSSIKIITNHITETSTKMLCKYKHFIPSRQTFFKCHKYFRSYFTLSWVLYDWENKIALYDGMSRGTIVEFCKYCQWKTHLKCKWIEVGEAIFFLFPLEKIIFFCARFTNYNIQNLIYNLEFIWRKFKKKIFSNYGQIVTPYILDIYTWDLTVTGIQLDNKNKLIGFIIFSKKTGTFVNRVWIDTRLYIFICCFGLVSSWITCWKHL